MCWWIFGHCWHHVEGSERKIPANKGKCKYSNPYVGFDKLGRFFVVRHANECCHCKKRKIVIYKNYNMTEYHTHRTYGEDNESSSDGERGIYWG